MDEKEKMILRIEMLENEQRENKASIAYLQGFIKGLEDRISIIENQHSESQKI